MSDVDDKPFKAILDNVYDSGFVPIAKPKVKRKNYVKKVEHVWSHEEIMQLIVAVEERPALWDVSAFEYRLPKTNAWQQVTHAIGNITVDDAKAKWTNLRISFKNNLAKYRSKKSAQDTDEAIIIHWRYFKSMMFLEADDVQQSTELSSYAMAFANTDMLTLDDFAVASPPPPCVASKKRKFCTNSGSSPTPSPSPTPSSNMSTRELAFNVLNSLTVRDKFSTFAEYVASELRALPPDRGAAVQRSLNRELLRLLDLEATQTPSAPPKY